MSNETIIVDDVFGGFIQDEYCYSKDDQEVILFGKTYTLEIRVKDDFEEDDKQHTDLNKENYKNFQQILIEENENILKAIKEYSEGTYPNYDYGGSITPFEDLKDPQPKDYLTPTTVVLDGEYWGILCDTDYEDEHGFAFWFEKDSARTVLTGFQGDAIY